mmetsp:Transcript_102827/g.299958  ORF Transcript_102827/g.299958 Transcript_102827/m.299958 type:complete len:87 (+) Transcript_102827:1726-1986(+)
MLPASVPFAAALESQAVEEFSNWRMTFEEVAAGQELAPVQPGLATARRQGGVPAAWVGVMVDGLIAGLRADRGSAQGGGPPPAPVT